MMHMNIKNQFKEVAAQIGIFFDGSIIADSTLHRIHIQGHKSGSKNGAYILHAGGGIAAGWGMDFKTGNSFKWRKDGRQPKLSSTDLAAIEAAKIQRQKEQVELHRQTAQKARKLWKGAIYADSNNDYCYRKNVQPHGCKTMGSGSLKGVLIVPLYDAGNKLVNLQFIQPDGAKRFLAGGKKKGCFFTIGEPTETILIAEGFATAASLFEYHGLQTCVAFDAGNLEPVAKIIRAKHPDSEIIICGDNDLSGVGQTKARAAALAVGGKYLIPSTPGHDWNDDINANMEGAH
jgi:putative DNA primase/helicase